MDSEVTFEDDPDEEMDTIAIEEEDWIEFHAGTGPTKK